MIAPARPRAGRPARPERRRCVRCRPAESWRSRLARPARITSGPAMTSVSLLARATVLPASSAAQVPASPALPTIAATTISTSGELHDLLASLRADEQLRVSCGKRRPIELARPPAVGGHDPPRPELRGLLGTARSNLRWADRATTCKLPARVPRSRPACCGRCCRSSRARRFCGASGHEAAAYGGDRDAAADCSSGCDVDKTGQRQADDLPRRHSNRGGECGQPAELTGFTAEAAWTSGDRQDSKPRDRRRPATRRRRRCFAGRTLAHTYAADG